MKEHRIKSLAQGHKRSSVGVWRSMGHRRQTRFLACASCLGREEVRGGVTCQGGGASGHVSPSFREEKKFT